MNRTELSVHNFSEVWTITALVNYESDELVDYHSFSEL